MLKLNELRKSKWNPYSLPLPLCLVIQKYLTIRVNILNFSDFCKVIALKIYFFPTKLMPLDGTLNIKGEIINFIPLKNETICGLGREKELPCPIHNDSFTLAACTIAGSFILT